MSNADLLIFTHQKAQEVDGVIDAIRAKGLLVTRINLCQYPEHSSYSWSTDSLYQSPNFSAARVAWLHNPGRYSISRSLLGHERELALNECEGFWEGLALATDLEWLNSPASLILSARKLSQIAVAKKFNITVPETLVSNDPDAAARFFAEHGGAVVKSLANGYSVYGEEQLKLYSRYYSALPDELARGLRFSPLIFQRRIPKHRELRVTCVDGECFGMVANVSDLDGNDIDIRHLNYESEKQRFSGTSVPPAISDASTELMRQFDLAYAGLDWIQDSNGKWYFLELNSMGAFKWSEMRGSGNITSAITTAICRRLKKNV